MADQNAEAINKDTYHSELSDISTRLENMRAQTFRYPSQYSEDFKQNIDKYMTIVGNLYDPQRTLTTQQAIQTIDDFKKLNEVSGQQGLNNQLTDREKERLGQIDKQFDTIKGQLVESQKLGINVTDNTVALPGGMTMRADRYGGYISQKAEVDKQVADYKANRSPWQALKDTMQAIADGGDQVDKVMAAKVATIREDMAKHVVEISDQKGQPTVPHTLTTDQMRAADIINGKKGGMNCPS